LALFFYDSNKPIVLAYWAVFVITVSIVIFTYNKLAILKDGGNQSNTTNQKQTALFYIFIGLAIVLISQVVTIFGGNHIELGNLFSRFCFPSFLGSNMAIAGGVVLLNINAPKRNAIFIGILTSSAAATQFYYCSTFAKEQRSLKDFFYQMSWRMPDVKKGTSFVMDYNPQIDPSSLNFFPFGSC